MTDKDKKIHINTISIILGTKCNLKCKHCAGGNPAPCVINENIIDSLFKNVKGISQIGFVGYEISLHKPQLKMIISKIIENGIDIQYVQFLTNAVKFDEELAHIFNDFRYNHTLFPNKATFQCSGDIFHFNSGFTPEILNENMKKYKSIIGDDCNFPEMNLSNGLTIIGNARNLTFEELDYVDEVELLPLNGYIFAKDYRIDCKGGAVCKGGKNINCIANFLTLTPNGYIFGSDLLALGAMADNNYSNALGNILNKPLLDIIENMPTKQEVIDNVKKDKNWNDYSKITYHHKSEIKWIILNNLYKYIKIRLNIIELIKQGKPSRFVINKIKEYETDIKFLVFDDIDKIKKNKIISSSKDLEDIEKEGAAFYDLRKYILKDFDNLKYLLNTMCIPGVLKKDNDKLRIFSYDSSKKIYNGKYIDIDFILDKSPFSNKNFKDVFNFEYDKFMAYWKSYYDRDFDIFTKLSKELFN